MNNTPGAVLEIPSDWSTGPNSYYRDKPETWQEELAERYIPRAGPPCDRTEHFKLITVYPPDASSHFYRFDIQEPDGTIHQTQGLDRTCAFSILRGLERAYRHGAKAGGEWSWIEFLRKVVGSEPSAASAPGTDPTGHLGPETPQQVAPSEESGTSGATTTMQDCSNKKEDA